MTAEPLESPARSARTMRVPDTLLILLVLAVAAWAATYVFVPGHFAMTGDPARIVAGSFTSAGEAQPAPLFGDAQRTGLLDLLFAGLVSGDRDSAAVGLMAFILVVGGVFGVILKTGAVEAAIAAALPDGRVKNETLVIILFVLFSLAGAVFGMGEEAIAVSLILIPALVRAGYDSLTGLIVCYVATQIGFATSWMNPFSVIVAQSIAGVPPMSGMGLRVLAWILFTLIGAVWLWRHARMVRLDPARSPVFDTDRHWRSAPLAAAAHGFRWPHATILAVLGLGIIWVAWGVSARGYYLGEIAAQFVGIGMVIGVVARVARLPGISGNSLMEAFRDGAVALAPAVLVIAAAKGIVLVMGGDDPAADSLLNSLLAGLAGVTGALPDWLTAWGMYLVQSLINLFIVSGSGQASVTMPLMAPLADLSGVSRQTAILAFQLGDGLTNLVVPTSAALMGCLAAARVDFVAWLRFFWRPMAALMALSSVFVIAAHAIGYT